MRRFERIHDVVEPVEDYRTGGYHPVHLHDVFNDRYEVIGKLSFGRYSTVWLAYDQRHHREVALKILKAKVSSPSKELGLLLALSNRPNHPGKDRVLGLLDHFEHEGPNGKHLCMVSNTMMSDGEDITATNHCYDPDFVRVVSKQVLTGLSFLHECGIIHCDLQPANILLTTLDAPPKISLSLPELTPVRWLDWVAKDSSAPSYLVTSQRPRGLLDDTDPSRLIVKIGDIGGVWGVTKETRPPITPVALRAPELIRKAEYDSSIDIWALGCSIFQFATKEPLFPLSTFGLGMDQIDTDHVSLIQQTTLLLRLKNLLQCFSDGDLDGFASFLQDMLQIDSQKRWSAGKLLRHPWLMSECRWAVPTYENQ